MGSRRSGEWDRRVATATNHKGPRRAFGGQNRLFAALVVSASLVSCSGSGCHPQNDAQQPASTSEAPNRWHYTVSPTPALDRLDVGLCFTGPAPAALVVDGTDVIAAVEQARDSEGRELVINREREAIELTGVGSDTCISYKVNLDTVFAEVSYRRASRIDDSVLMTVGTWLWRPKQLPDEPRITMSWELPADMAVSHPFAPADLRDVVAHAPKPKGEVVSLSRTTFRWRSQVAFGPFEVEKVEAAGATFSIVALGETELSREGRAKWVATAASTVALLFGQFPVPRAQILVIPSGRGTSPVYFGLTSRGGGASVAALVSTSAGDAKFVGEWVLIHEFLHLGMPFVRSDDVWLSEGFVTYYTEVLRTRAGFRSHDKAWRAIVSGFRRGRRSASGQTLAEASARMHEQHAYDRIYWGGAAIALVVDVLLRTKGEHSLDDAMKQLHTCCAHSPRQWSADEVLEVFDAFFGSREISQICARELARPTFTDLQQTFEAIGIREREGEVVLASEGDAARLRTAICGG